MVTNNRPASISPNLGGRWQPAQPLRDKNGPAVRNLRARVTILLLIPALAARKSSVINDGPVTLWQNAYAETPILPC